MAAAKLNWHLDILPDDQRTLWEETLQAGFPGWVLYGGTALALRLGHRTSVDFDFFSSAPVVPLEFREFHKLDGPVLQSEANTLSVVHRGVKLSFFGALSLGVMEPPDLLGRCPVAALEDLAACKLAALVNRVELKDYLDIAALLRHGLSLSCMLACANAVYRGEFPVAACLKSLAWFDDPALAPLSSADRHLLETAALGIDRIPTMAVSGRKIGQTP
jgi:hypothetical protein